MKCKCCNKKFNREEEEEMEEVYCFIHEREELFCPICIIRIERGEESEHEFKGGK